MSTYLLMEKLHFDTLQVHSGHKPDRASLSRAVPIYQTTAYAFKSSEHAEQLFNLETEGDIYTRLSNPTTEILEKRMASLEGGVAALAVSSGHSAQFIALNNIMENGDNFVSTPFLYGGSYSQFTLAFKRLGIEARISASIDVVDFERLIDDRTKAIYVETIGNPSFVVPDFEAFAQLSKKYGIPLVVDNTFGAGGFLCRPIEYGANIVVESATKWIGGHGTSMGGVIVDGGNFDWGNGRFACLTEPSEGYHGLRFWDKFGQKAYIVRARVEGLRDFGPAISPFNAFLLLQGIETLSLRVQRSADNTLALAQWLQNHSKVESVSYPGLASDPNHALAKKYLRHGFGAVLSFTLKKGKKEGVKLVESLQLVSHLANVGDNKTLIIQPSTTTHNQLSEAQQLAAGVSPGLLRVSLGIEHIDDIIADFEQALS